LKPSILQVKPQYCFGIDDNYVWPLLICLYSAKRSSRKFRKVNIVFDPRFLNQKAIKEIENKCNLMGISPQFISLQTPKNSLGTAHITPTAYLRLQIAEVFQSNVIWFDTDLLFLKGWTKILKYVEAKEVNKYGIFARKHWGNPESTSNQAMIRAKGQYFNSGVLLINSNFWRYNGISKEVSSIISKDTNLGFEWADQCILNYYFQGEYGKIAPEFNSIPAEYAKNRTRILHFAGTHKPWTNYMNLDGDFVDIEVSPYDMTRGRIVFRYK
jgi:lipopolysaccharide biosynthesis glycosyltransferase